MGGEGVVFAGWADGGFLPFIVEGTLLVETGEESIESALHHRDSPLAERAEQVGWVGSLAAENEEHRELQESFAHLGADVIDHGVAVDRGG